MTDPWCKCEYLPAVSRGHGDDLPEEFTQCDYCADMASVEQSAPVTPDYDDLVAEMEGAA